MLVLVWMKQMHFTMLITKKPDELLLNMKYAMPMKDFSSSAAKLV